MRPEQLVEAITSFAQEKKANDVVVLDLREVVGYTDYFVICSGNTSRQTKAIHDGILEGLKHEHKWILMDYLDVVAHIFTPQARDFYRLEDLWGEAPAHPATAAESA